MENVIVITGASSGFGALAARALARAGHIVYASMRDTTGRNAPQAKEVEQYAAEHGVDLRPIDGCFVAENLVTPLSRRSFQRTGAWMWSFTTPATWSSVQPKRSHPNNSLSCMTSTY